MVFIDIVDENGKVTGTAHLNLGRRNVKLCRFCHSLDNLRALSTKLCDFVVSPPEQITHKRTCDAPICDKHATKVGPDVDYCPDHKHAAPQKALEFGKEKSDAK
jgi:hypothetical protein